MTPIFKSFIDVSNEFRKSNASKQSVEKLYDLCYELEKTERNREEDFILCNIYTLLGFHRSAYEIFKTIADKSNPKDVSKLYVWEQKANSHENNFIIKDLRKFQTRKKQNKLRLKDFIPSGEENTFLLKKDEIIIFNKVVDTSDFSVFIHKNHNFQENFDQISEYLLWLSDCKTELIAFFNQKMKPDILVDNSWYDSLDVYCALVGIDDKRNLFTEISMGDTLSPDHILEVEIENYSFISIELNG